jgi:hypothetical protein
MFLEKMNVFIEEIKTTETQENAKKISAFLQDITQMNKINLERSALSSFNDYLHDVITPTENTKEDLACMVTNMVYELRAFQNYLTKEKIIVNNTITPLQEVYYKIIDNLKTSLNKYKEIRKDQYELEKDYKKLMNMLSLIVNEIEHKVLSINNPEHLLLSGIISIAYFNKRYSDDVFTPFTLDELEKEKILTDEDKYILSKYLDFIESHTNKKYTLDEAVMLFNQYHNSHIQNI